MTVKETFAFTRVSTDDLDHTRHQQKHVDFAAVCVLCFVVHKPHAHSNFIFLQCKLHTRIQIFDPLMRFGVEPLSCIVMDNHDNIEPSENDAVHG